MSFAEHEISYDLKNQKVVGCKISDTCDSIQDLPNCKELEKQVVLFFKPLVYDFLAKYNFKRLASSIMKFEMIGDKYVEIPLTEQIQYVLVGAGALEFQSADPTKVKTLDADVHIWNNYLPELNKPGANGAKKQIVVRVLEKMENYFNHPTFIQLNKGTIDYFQKKCRNVARKKNSYLL